MPKMTIPNQISLARICLTPLLILAGWLGYSRTFLILFALLLISDFLDGFLARWLDRRTRLGAQLDTGGDVLMAVCSITGGWLLWPDRVASEAPFFFSVLGLLGLSGIICLIKYRHFPSYHTWSAKTATAIAGSGVWIFFAGVTPWVFRLSIAVLAIAAVEEILITFILPQWHPNVPNVICALRERRKKQSVDERYSI